MNFSINDVVIDRCDHNHVFAKLPDHPVKDGRARCPHCLVIGLDIRDKELLTNTQEKHITDNT